MIRPIALAVLVTLTASQARAEDCAVESASLRAHLEYADDTTFSWNTAWTIGFGVAAVASFASALTEWNPLGKFDQNYKETMIVSGTKATIGVASRFTVPLRVHMPAHDADSCVELASLRKEALRLRKQERGSFWLTIFGGTALNLAGAGVLWYRRSFSTGAISFAIGFPVGLASALTQPTRTWRLVDAQTTWSAGVVPTDGGAMAVLGGAF
ncbi:MAG TPA: hypothetical protein VGM39_07085 [Kofleriaceae bacterium]